MVITPQSDYVSFLNPRQPIPNDDGKQVSGQVREAVALALVIFILSLVALYLFRNPALLKKMIPCARDRETSPPATPMTPLRVTLPAPPPPAYKPANSLSSSSSITVL